MERLKVSEDTSLAAKTGDYKKGDFVFSLTNLRKITRPRSVNGSGDLIPSHLYVRFKPVMQAHIDAIEAGNIPTYPYPLATDSLDMSNPDYSTIYTFLPISKLLPNCPYEVLDTIMMLKPETEAVTMAYAAAGKTSRVLQFSDAATAPRSTASTNYYLEPMPCDQWSDEPMASNSILPPEECDNPPPPNPPPPPPAPTPLLPADPRPIPNTVSFNSCSMNTDVNYPSGRITVEETQWGNGGTAYEGVADIKIEILGPNGQRVVTQTNRFGCFKASGAIRGFRPLFGPYLPVIMNVIFESDRKEIRGYNDAVNIAQYSQPLKHIYGNICYRMNDANVSYERHTGMQDNDTKYYVAATVNNALYEFDEYAAQDGILPPHNNLKILVHKFASDGATPMFNVMKNTHPLEYATISGFFTATVAPFASLITGDLVTGSLIAGNIALNAPDVAIGYNWNAADFATDQIKEIAYHEFAHASHYRNTSFQFWVDNINFITHNALGGGYGDATDPGVEKTDLIEMWGYFLGREYAHKRYGPNAHSALLIYATGAATFLNSWYAWNENNNDEDLFEWEHIPAGFLHDIRDDNTYNRDSSLLEHNIVGQNRDSISGYSISTIFNGLNANTTTAAQLIEGLKWQLPVRAGNTLANYDTLKIRYGY